MIVHDDYSPTPSASSKSIASSIALTASSLTPHCRSYRLAFKISQTICKFDLSMMVSLVGLNAVDSNPFLGFLACTALSDNVSFVPDTPFDQRCGAVIV